MSEKRIRMLGMSASFMSIMMYVSYFPQIINNLNGMKGDFIQPAVATLNSFLWLCYGFFKESRDWPLVLANIPGIIFGILTVVTALI